jgi:hypothetical protein
MALLQSVWVTLGHFSDFWQHAREDFEAEVLLVSKSVGPPLDDADLGVDPFDEAQDTLFSSGQYDAIPSQWSSIIRANFSYGLRRCHRRADFQRSKDRRAHTSRL